MKASNRSSLITGIVLLALAAVFAICLILQPLDFGAGSPGHNNIFYLLGNMLYSVYGFSSILVPGFLLISGLSCFATIWTARKTMHLITALIPFFTCVITENICRSILAVKSNFAGVKIGIAIITGIMLVIIEWLGAGILADKINEKAFKRPSRPADDNNQNDEDNSFKPLKKFNLNFPKTFKKVEEDYSDDEDDENDQTDIAEEYEEESYENSITSISDDEEIEEDPFDAALAAVDAEEEQTEAENNQIQEETSVTETPAPAPAETSDEEEPANPASIISQEEYAALTSPEGLTEPADELEWSNLPPAPDTLPPEYDEEIDENDPSLAFPPAEEDPYTPAEESLPEQKDEEINNDDSYELQEENFPIEINQSISDSEPFDVDFASEDEDSKLQEEHEPYVFDSTSDDEIENQMEENQEEISDEEPAQIQPESTGKLYPSNDNPYAAARYIDSVVENPNFPYGITLHDDDPVTIGEKKTESPKKSAFPAKITLDSDSDYNRAPKEPVYDYDVIKTPAINLEREPEIVPEFDELDSEIADYEDFAEDAQNEEVEETTEPAEETAPAAIISQIATKNAVPPVQDYSAPEPVSTPKKSLADAAHDVFSDMEADIRREQPPRPVVQEETEIEQEEVSSEDEELNDSPDFDITGNQIVSENTPTLKQHGATNLTADELTDFFNAQQAENTPKGTEIAANPPKIGNRATKKGPYVIPSDLLIAYKDDQYWIIDDATKEASLNLKQTLSEFGIEADIIGIKKGPVVTMFEILPAPGVRLNKIVALQDNIALSLAAQSVRIVAPIPGKQAVGIEIPNRHRSVVGFREIIEMDLPDWKKMAVPVILGKDILGKAQLIDLVKTPHMLIAGATGSGKSVCVNSLILSILYKRSFRDVKMILVDPKVVELKLYNNIPHLLTPVITEPKKALQALKWALCEMERRYALLDQMGVRDISNYNQKIKEQKICTEKLPYIVIIIDEFADLMATSGRELESVIARLTAMSRAVGIHLVLATQRPSVNVITGLIKANIPSRIAFMVASRTDSNIIIDTVGAEKLLGRGDMLYASAVDPAPVRIQGTFISDQEVEDVVRTVKEYGEPDYIDDEIFVDDEEDDSARDLFGEPMDDDDPLYDQALEIVVQTGKASASYIQRRLKIGYNRAARIVEEMEERGIVGPANGSKPREVIHIPN